MQSFHPDRKRTYVGAWPENDARHCIGKDRAARSLERIEFLSLSSWSASTYTASSARIHPAGWISTLERIFFPFADVRLERELIYDSQFDERPRGRKKRSFFSENEHQRPGEKKKVRESHSLARSFKKERERGKRDSRGTTTRAERRLAKVNRQQARGMKLLGAFRWRAASTIRSTFLRDADVTQRETPALSAYISSNAKCMSLRRRSLRFLIYYTRRSVYTVSRFIYLFFFL